MRIVLALIFFGVGLQAADLVLAGATTYPSPDATPIADSVIVIKGERIAAVGPRASIKIPAGARVVNCAGRFITAGFWNSHVHIITPDLLRVREAGAVTLNTALDAMFNRWGFTTVFDLASALDNTLALRGRITSGEVRGPRILTVGEPIWTRPPVYVRDYLTANRIQIPITSTAADARARVIALAQKGVNGIKLFTGSLQERGQVDNMPLEMVRAASAEAHRHKLPVFAHPQNSQGVEDAIAGGVDILAHTVPQSEPWTPEFVARLRSAHIALIPTLTLFDFEARKEPGETDSDREQWIAKMVAELRVFVQNGGEVLFGTDAGYIDHFDTALEFTLMARAGMTFNQILASLTTNPARRFGSAERSGRVAVNSDADLTVLESDPAKDITALSRVHLAIRAGKVLFTAASIN